MKTCSLFALFFFVGLGGCATIDEEIGSWLDERTNLTWQTPGPDEEFSLDLAGSYCDRLVLDGNNDWRLPTISELRTMIKGCPATETGGACSYTDLCGNQACTDDQNNCQGCYGSDCYWRGPEHNCGYFWSSTKDFGQVDYLYYYLVDFRGAEITTLDPYITAHVRCVR